jgi:hypothetical protein
VKITVEMCDEFFIGFPQIFDGVKSVALRSAKKKDHKGLQFRSYLYRGHAIDASYQVSVHLAKWFQRRFFLIGQ